MKRPLLWFAGILYSSVALISAQTDKDEFPRLPPVEPAKAEKTFVCQDGFQMQLLAAEPMVTDPVAAVYDENGLLYVVEMNDYPYTDKTTHQAWKDNTTDKPIGKIRVLEDTNGDGKFDKSYIFAENLSWPTGIACWKGGVFVTATPDIWYFKDTTGDHKADVRKKVFTGFRKYNVQAVMNNPIWGLDNKLYVAGASNGGKVVPGEDLKAKPITISRNDYRIDPVTEEFELIAGGARFGNTFDNYGNRFICNIRNPAQQIVLENRYFARNPFLPVPSAIYDSRIPGDTLPIYRISPVEPWRELRAQRWSVDPAQAKTPRSELSGGGVFTSSSGITIYRGAAYATEYDGDAFLGEVANNVIHRQKLTADGVVFKAEPADGKAEFVASTDTWFRPVNFVNAPDGTFHVLDMYREVIEHPWSIPDDIRENIDLESGRDRGRIYRLAPPNFKAKNIKPQLGKASTAELVSHLENPNAWWRETAQRLLVERQDKTAVGSLQKLIEGNRTPLGRIHALWTLQGLNAVSENDLLRGLSDESPRVREQAIKLSEGQLATSKALFDKVAQLASDKDARVRFQVALSVGEAGPQATPVLTRIAFKDREDPWIRAAVSSATPDTCALLLAALAQTEQFATEGDGPKWIRQLAFIVGAQNKAENMNRVLMAYDHLPYCKCDANETLIVGLGEGLRQTGKNFRTAFANPEAIGAEKVDGILAGAKANAQTREADAKERRTSVQLLGFDEFANAKPILEKLLDARESQEIQIATVRSLSGFKNAEVANLLIAPWRSMTPAVREEVLSALFARKERLKPLLEAVQSGIVAAPQVSATRKTSLLNHADPALKEFASKVFGQELGSRKDVSEKYKISLSLKGNRQNGEKVFDNNCMVCHRFAGKGIELGPNLETVQQWEPEKLLMNILEPNREVASNHVAYEIELKDGSTLSGLIAEETASSITLRRAESTEETILRSNIERITSSGLSIMPEGLEANIPPQDMADLLAYLAGKQ
ncbi:MAG: HEAT repeat domain-containing protein [Verrucomicrobia bacterium]|nr:HEAT repeat domain-containing protein [Verrucomicrobiota bacterium]